MFTVASGFFIVAVTSILSTISGRLCIGAVLVLHEPAILRATAADFSLIRVGSR